MALAEWKVLGAEHAAHGLPSAAVRRQLGDPDCPFDLGVHLNLTQGRPLGDGYPGELLDAQGRFPGIFALFARLRRSRGRFGAAIHAELERQVQVVRDHGLQPSHLNGHQYVEMIPAVTEVLTTLGIRVVRVAWEPSLLRSTVLRGQFWKWPLARVKRAFARRFRARMDALDIVHPDAFHGTVHAGSIDLELLWLFLAGDRGRWLVEVGLHPGEGGGITSPQDWLDGWHNPLAAARPDELRMLVSDELPALLESSGSRWGGSNNGVRPYAVALFRCESNASVA